MNNERVLEAFRKAELGDWTYMDTDGGNATVVAKVLAEAVRELAWFANSCAGNKALFGGDRRRWLDDQCLAAAIVEENHE